MPGGIGASRDLDTPLAGLLEVGLIAMPADARVAIVTPVVTRSHLEFALVQ
jgi:hypothetical protein